MTAKKRKALILGDGEQAVQFYLDFGHELDVRIEGFVQDRDPKGAGRKLEGLPVYTPEEAASLAESHGIFSVIGAEPRGRFVRRMESLGFESLTVVHPLAVVSPYCEIGEGSCIYPLVGIAARVKMGRHVLVARNAVVGHNCEVGDFATVSAGCMIPGHVKIGRESYLGIGAVMVGHLEIGERALVGAGAVVTQDVPPGVIVAGNPARVLRPREVGMSETGEAGGTADASGDAIEGGEEKLSGE